MWVPLIYVYVQQISRVSRFVFLIKQDCFLPAFALSIYVECYEEGVSFNLYKIDYVTYELLVPRIFVSLKRLVSSGTSKGHKSSPILRQYTR